MNELHPTQTLRRISVNFLVTAISLMIALLIAEMVVRVYLPFTIEVRPLYGVSPVRKIFFVPGFEGTRQTEEYAYTITANSLGRRDIEWTQEMLDDPDNIVFIGDSFVMGAGVENEDTLPTLLERAFAEEGQDREVFNFGIGGAISIPEYLELLEESISVGIQSKLVLVGVFIGNDFHKGAVAVDQRGAGNSKRAGSKEEERKTPIRSKLVQLITDTIKNSTVLTGLALKLGDSLGVKAYRSPAAYIYMHEWTESERAFFDQRLRILADIRDRARSKGKRLGIVIFPNKIQVENSDALTGEIYDSQKPNRMILDFCAGNDLECLDLLPVLSRRFKEAKQPLFYPVDRHFNPQGYQFVAQEILRWLRETRLAAQHAVQ